MAAVPQEFWLVATSLPGSGSVEDRDGLFEQIKGNSYLNPVSRNRDAAGENGPWKVLVPDGDRSLVFGSFDNLIRLTDDLQKADNQVNTIVHRLERQWLDIDPKAQFRVKSQRLEKSFNEYMMNWQWDEAKYPRSRSILDNLTHLMTTVNKIDEEARNKTQQYNEYKSTKANLTTKDGLNLPSRDLIDVLTPSVMKSGAGGADDFISSEHLTTVFVILPRGADKEFLAQYETYCPNVVPMSAKHFGSLDDKDGNSIWRVVVFRANADEFKKHCRERRLVPRDFEYSAEAYQQLVSQRESVEESVKRHHTNVRGLYQAAWSDSMVAWVHVKAMRVFVESVLRFGMPPRFACFAVAPKANAFVSARKALAQILVSTLLKNSGMEKMAEAGGDDTDEYFPYVSFSFTPFAVHAGVSLD